jgi:putative sigma-54 modulation protein
MEIHFTARHFDVAPELRDHITRKLEKLAHVQDGIREAKVILTGESYRHIVEISLLARRREFMSREAAGDMYSAADSAIEKLDQQLRRFKDKRLARGRRNGRQAPEPVPLISLREQVQSPEPLSVDEALERLDDEGGEVLVFENRETRKTTVLYRREDGSYGLIEPAS